MMDASFDNWENEIKEYCEDNDLSFDKAQDMYQSWNKEFLALLYHDPEKGKRGLMDETPATVVLIMDLVDGKPVFTQTEYTRQYLG